MNIVIPMAGAGSRFAKEGYDLPKPLILVDSVPMIVRAIQTLGIAGKYHFITRGSDYTYDTLGAINSVCLDPVVINIEHVTEGAAQTVLLMKDYINSDEELIIVNCDQVMSWDADAALADMRQYDGAVVAINSQDPKHSYVKVDAKGLATEFAEKKVISDLALTGIHYWKHGKDFVSSAEQMISDNVRSGNGEYYVAPTYNYLLKQKKKIGVTVIRPNQIHFTGTPEDLDLYHASR
jgi:dTDP-glucose pyrophosphorylase